MFDVQHSSTLSLSALITRLRLAVRHGVLLWALGIFCAMEIGLLVAQVGLGLFREGEVGFGDLYVLHSVRRLIAGEPVYPGPSQVYPIPAAVVYGPGLYGLLGLPMRLLSTSNPFLVPRLTVALCFLLCSVVAMSLTRRLAQNRLACIWALVLSLAVAIERPWVIALRGDFPAILLSLASIRLLVSNVSGAWLLAGLLSGFALQFKATYVSACLTGIIWALMSRSWRRLIAFGAAAGLSSVGCYWIEGLVEPHMFANLSAIRHPLFEVKTLISTLLPNLLGEPVILLSLAGLPLACKGAHTKTVVLLYSGVALLVQTVGCLQVGANINYFFEPLIALLPFGGIAAASLTENGRGVQGRFAAMLLVLTIGFPGWIHSVRSLRDQFQEVRSWTARLREVRHILESHQVLSFVPDATYLSPDMTISEPYLLGYLAKAGSIDLRPLTERIANRQFDLVVTASHKQTWRGVPHIPALVQAAIDNNYEVMCDSPPTGIAFDLRGNLYVSPEGWRIYTRSAWDSRFAGLCDPITSTSHRRAP